MKRLIGHTTVLVTVLFLLGLFAVNANADERDFGDLAKLVPDDTLAYLELNNVPKIVDDFFKLEFWENGDEARKIIEALVKDKLFNEMQKDTWPKDFLAKHLSNIHTARLVLVDVDKENINKPPRLIIQFVVKDANMLNDFLNLPDVNKGLNQTYNMNGVRIYAEKSENPHMYMGVKSNVLYIALKRECLDHLLGLKPFIGRPLSGNANFSKVMDEYKGAGFWGYINAQRLATIIEGEIDKEARENEKKAVHTAIDFKNFGVISFANWFDRGLGNSKVTVNFTGPMPGYDKFRQSPVKSEIIKFFPADVVGGAAASTANAPESWEFLKQIIFEAEGERGKKRLERDIDRMEQMAGFKLPEILKAAKGEVGIFMLDIPAPAPKMDFDKEMTDEDWQKYHEEREKQERELMSNFALVLRAEDPKKMEEVFAAALKNIKDKAAGQPGDQPGPPILETEAKYRDVKISIIDINGDNGGPVLYRAWVGNVLMMSIYSDKAIKKAIDARKDEKHIVAGADKKSIEGMPEKTSLIFFFRPGKLLGNENLVPKEYSTLLKKNMLIYFCANMEEKRITIASNSPFSGAMGPVGAAIVIPFMLMSSDRAMKPVDKMPMREHDPIDRMPRDAIEGRKKADKKADE